MIDKIEELENKLELHFNNKELLLQALCHRSYLNENHAFSLGHNERLEFLGDAVLELVVTEYLYLNYPDKSEGELTTWRASLVNTKVIGKTARKIGIYDHILLSKGESRETGKSRICILADTFEAVVGAAYLDLGYEKVKLFIEKNLITELPRIIELGLYRDPKSVLQEETQKDTGITPEYKVIKEVGPDHKKHFEVGVFIEEKIIGRGDGHSKKDAEEKAAKVALLKKGWLKNNN